MKGLSWYNHIPMRSENRLYVTHKAIVRDRCHATHCQENVTLSLQNIFAWSADTISHFLLRNHWLELFIGHVFLYTFLTFRPAVLATMFFLSFAIVVAASSSVLSFIAIFVPRLSSFFFLAFFPVLTFVFLLPLLVLRFWFLATLQGKTAKCVKWVHT